jgi:hypothetical protein
MARCVTCVSFSHMQRFFSQVSNSNTFNVLLTPHVNNIVVHFGLINYFFTLPIHFETWQPLVQLF